MGAIAAQCPIFKCYYQFQECYIGLCIVFRIHMVHASNIAIVRAQLPYLNPLSRVGSDKRTGMLRTRQFDFSPLPKGKYMGAAVVQYSSFINFKNGTLDCALFLEHILYMRVI